MVLTLESAMRRIAELEQENRDLRAQLKTASEREKALILRIEKLEQQIFNLTKSSQNSSKPPSSDPPEVKAAAKADANRKKRARRKRGGQAGHKVHRREFLDPDEVKHLIPTRCGNRFSSRDTAPVRHQQIELPPVNPVVTDYYVHQLKCHGCGNMQRGALPTEALSGTFGPRLCAMIGLCAGRYRMSKRLIQELYQDLFGVRLALGSVSNIEHRLSASLEEPYNLAGNFVRKQNSVHADETGWTEDKNTAWLWVMSCANVAYFHINLSRGSAVAKQLLGCDFSGTLTSDRWVGYGWLDVANRQLCWAHLLRDFQGWIDCASQGAEFGEALAIRVGRVFALWRSFREGTIDRLKLIRKLRKHQIAVGAALTMAAECDDANVRGMAKRILKL